MDLNVFTLNCWMIPIVSKDINARIKGLGKFLQQSNYDIVCLQEVWRESYFLNIKSECSSTFPFSRCFFSGRLGTSGVCIFSRYPIMDTFFHPFMLNGYWYALNHGDNHVCRGIAYAKLSVQNVTVNCFILHLHAEHDPIKDPYFVHRIAQSYELLKFTNLISNNGTPNKNTMDIIIGDLNFEPQDLGISLLKSGGFKESWLETHSDELGATCDLPRNCYTPKDNAFHWPEGRKLDYIFYRTGSLHCRVTDCQVQDLRLETLGVPLSDHEALTAVLNMTNIDNKLVISSGKQKLAENGSSLDNALLDVQKVILSAVDKLTKENRNYMFYCLFWLLIGLASILFIPSFINVITTPVYVLILCILGLHYFLVKRQELTHLLELSHQIAHDLNLKKAQ